MNSGGVALATDSAVTIPQGRLMKHYRGACKLVASHAKAPIAMLWYGSPDYLGVPWEVIVKSYRDGRETTFPKLGDYAEDFLDYVETDVPSWALGVGDLPASVLARGLIERVEKKLARQEVQAAEAVEQGIGEWKKAQAPRARVLDDAVVASCPQLLEWLEVELDRLDEIDGKLPDSAREQLGKAARSAWSHLSAHEPLHTGLVFAGFGDHDRLPAMRSYLIGVPAERNRRWLEGIKAAVSSATPAVIVPFAQNDQVKLFMEGLHPDLRKMLDGLIEEVSDHADLGSIGAKMKDQLNQYIDEQGKPVVDAVRFLPKADLAEFARAVIAFTALRLRMSMAPETVGEPIDVAIVSRSEGVVWVHRSHYFPPELNPHFFSRYRLS
ncbi:MAG TPA: hypothetical protein VIM28_04325 [Solirubrobacterales bacterium]